ncbi:MAG: tetratricopeptide repeat protein [Planctomycetes bacterium]|nr:tetratricopeptide repeat protein [Planctomycetota bacterium]
MRSRALMFIASCTALLLASGCTQADPQLPHPSQATAAVDQDRVEVLASVDRLIQQPTLTSPTVEVEGIRAEPLSPEALREQAQLYRVDLLVGSGQPEQALKELREILVRNPDATLVRSKLIGVQLRLGQQEEALQGYRDLIERDPKNAVEYMQSSTQMLVQLGRFDEALADISKAIDREPGLMPDKDPFDAVGRYCTRATIYDRLGRSAEAAADRQRASDLENKAWPTRPKH